MVVKLVGEIIVDKYFIVYLYNQKLNIMKKGSDELIGDLITIYTKGGTDT